MPLATRRAFLRKSATIAAVVPAIATARVLGANDRIGIALIGCGGRGNHHLGRVSELKNAGVKVEIVAACDVYRPRLDRTAKAHGVKAYMRHKDLLADPNVDVVCIATPDHVHGYQAFDAVEAGKDVYCEKPITHWRQFELTKKLRDAVARTRRVLQVGTQGLSDRAWSQSATLIKEGAIGRPVHAECGYFRVGDWGERGMPIDDPNAKAGPDLDWEAFLGDSPKRDFDVSRFFRWRMYRDYAGGPVTDLFPHSFTPVVRMLGVTFPSLVVATAGMWRYKEREVPDTFNMLVDYPEEITVAVLGTQANDFGTLGNDASAGQRGAGGRVPVIRGWDATLTVEGNEIVIRPVGKPKDAAKRVPIERGENELEHWRDLLACVESRKSPASDVHLGLHVQTALQMAMLSHVEGKVVRFERSGEKLVVA
jgi:predicted dehydrogenase